VNTLTSSELVDADGSVGIKLAQPPNVSRGTYPGGSLILSEEEVRVLDALSLPHRLTFGQLMRATALDREELRLALSDLHAKGLTVRLETVVESYSCHIAGPMTASPQERAGTSAWSLQP
jgi:ferric iron reductase protein FhuF